MNRRDGCLQLIRTRSTNTQGSLDQRLALDDRFACPERAILRFEQHRTTVGRRETRRSTCIVQQHERQQPHHLRLVWHEVAQRATEANRLGGQLVADDRVAGGGGIAFVEDQVDHRQHGVEPLWQQVICWDLIRDSRVADLALGSREALSERGFGHEQRAGYLRGREPTQRAQRQRNLSLEG